MPKANNPIQDKTYAFAQNVVRFCKMMIEDKKEYVLSKQFMRSGTSVGANVEEGIHAPSKKDFAHKLSIALKEAHESRYWIRLIRDGLYATPDEVKDLLKQIEEIIAMLTAIIKTARQSLNQ